MNVGRRFLFAFVYAGRGVARTLAVEINMRVHFTAALTVLLFNAVVRPTIGLVALDVLACTVVIGLELVNSAIEALTDLATQGEWLHGAAVAKDAGAAAVLVAAVSAVVVGVFVGVLSWPWHFWLFRTVHISGAVVTAGAFVLWLWSVGGAFVVRKDKGDHQN